jgi:GTP-sensing pleiotropic transcriptional regulator CodY
MEREVAELKDHLDKLYKVLFTLQDTNQDEKKTPATPMVPMRRSRLGKGKRWEQIRMFLDSHAGKWSADGIAQAMGVTRSTVTSSLNRHKRGLLIDRSTQPYLYTLR